MSSSGRLQRRQECMLKNVPAKAQEDGFGAGPLWGCGQWAVFLACWGTPAAGMGVCVRGLGLRVLA